MPFFPELELKRKAMFSDCRTWRYTLFREWDEYLPQILFILLNPSTADAKKDDPTNKRCMKFAKGWGFGSLIFVNLFAVRGSDTEVILESVDPVGPENDEIILAAAGQVDKIVVGWGNLGMYQDRHLEVLELLHDEFPLWCFGVTQKGCPLHPSPRNTNLPNELILYEV